MSSTLKAAELMLERGGWWSAGMLAGEIGKSARYASGILANIRKYERYEVEVTDLPNRLVMVKKILPKSKTGPKKRVEKVDLWKISLGVGR